MKNKLVLNGQFFIQKTTGQQRYAKEILMELDKIIKKDELILVVPKNTDIPDYKNIRIDYFGFLHNRLWEQFCLPFYLLKNRCRSFSFCNTTPLFCPGPTVIHDIIIKEHPEYFTTLKGKIARFYYNLNLFRVIYSSFPIVTVTEFSKKSILTYYKIPAERIFVISNAWQHFERVEENKNFFTMHSEIKRGSYYFALGSRAAQKNFKWIYDNAVLYPENLYLVAGKTVANFKSEKRELPNLKYLGFLSDGDVKALMVGCKAFLFPSLFEGFGIPPLEALFCGAKVVSSFSSCMPEVLGGSVYYIDPHNANVDLNSIISGNLSANVDDVLLRYTWKKSAVKLYELIKKYGENTYA